METKMYKIWVKFNHYTGNFEREFAAYMFGYEHSDCNGYYEQYVNDYKENASNLFSLEEKTLFTLQKVDDWDEHTFYNIAKYPYSDGTLCNGIFFQFTEKPTKEEFEAFRIRANGFPKFINELKSSCKSDLKVEEVSAEVINVESERIM